MKYIVDRPEYKMYMTIKDSVAPTDLKSVEFTRELWNVEKNKIIMTSTFELFVPRKQLNEIAAQLIENS